MLNSTALGRPHRAHRIRLQIRAAYHRDFKTGRIETNQRLGGGGVIDCPDFAPFRSENRGLLIRLEADQERVSSVRPRSRLGHPAVMRSSLG